MVPEAERVIKSMFRRIGFWPVVHMGLADFHRPVTCLAHHLGNAVDHLPIDLLQPQRGYVVSQPSVQEDHTIDLDDGTASLALAMSVVGYFELNEDEARAIAVEVGQAVATWREEAAQLNLTRAEIVRMASAFEHQDLSAALSIP